jgi:hypothetical protein
VIAIRAIAEAVAPGRSDRTLEGRVKPPAKNSNPIGQSRHEALRAAIAREEARLDRLEAAQADVRKQLVPLRSELAALGDAPHLPAGSQRQSVSGWSLTRRQESGDGAAPSISGG